MKRIGLQIRAQAGPGVLHELTGVLAKHEADIEAIEILSNHPPESSLYVEVRVPGSPEALVDEARGLERVLAVELVETFQKVFGKRVIIVGGGAQVGQVGIGAISEADRHNIRGEHISVDTIPLVGETPLAEAVRAVARLPRARVLVLAGALMGGSGDRGDQPEHGRQRPRCGRPGRHGSDPGRRDGCDGDRRHRGVQRATPQAQSVLARRLHSRTRRRARAATLDGRRFSPRAARRRHGGEEMRDRGATLAFGLTLLAGTAAAQGQSQPLAEALRLYWNGEYAATLERLAPADIESLDAGERVEAHKYRASSLIALGRKSQRFADGKALYEEKDYTAAKATLDEVLRIDPDFQLASEYVQLCEAHLELAAQTAQLSPAAAPAPTNDNVFNLTSDIEPPVLTRQVDPSYPEIDRRWKNGGDVVINQIIGIDGSVRDAVVIRGVNPRIDAEAVRAVKRWRYTPARRDGYPVAVYKLAVLRFVP
jgi:TonB family protein